MRRHTHTDKSNGLLAAAKHLAGLPVPLWAGQLRGGVERHFGLGLCSLDDTVEAEPRLALSLNEPSILLLSDGRILEGRVIILL